MAKPTFKQLQIFNYALAGLHLVQAMIVLAISNLNFTLPVSASFLTFEPAADTLLPASHDLFDLPLVWLVVGFFLLSAVAHLVIATVYRKKYEADLEKGMNQARWIEYSLSASTMMVGIALLVGIYDLASLIMIFVLTAVMNLLGWVMEVHNQTTEKTNWLSFNIGCLAGIVPWVAVALYFWASNTYGSGDIPAFVYWIYVTIFIFFNCFALNMWLQYKKIGPWKDYLFGEKAYMVLSLVAKTALAWQLFAGTLRP